MKKIEIVYEDRNIIVVNKESGLLTIGTNKERDRTLLNPSLKRKNGRVFGMKLVENIMLL